MSNFTCMWSTESRRITSPYGPRKIGDGFHDGIDVGRLEVSGEDIRAAHDGTVAMSYFSKSYGNCVIIDDKLTNYSTLYGHMLDRRVMVGQVLIKGDLIGHMGTTGNSTGVHLHFEVRDRHYDSKYWNSHEGEFYSSQDPMKFLVEDNIDIKDDLDMAIASLGGNLLSSYTFIGKSLKDLEHVKLLVEELYKTL